MSAKQRIDPLLVERKLVDSREKAQALILAGNVLVNGQREDKAGHSVAPDSRVELIATPRYVGRGGLKLEAALEHWEIDVDDTVCLTSVLPRADSPIVLCSMALREFTPSMSVPAN